MSQFAFDVARRAQQKAIRRRRAKTVPPRQCVPRLSAQQQRGRAAEQRAAHYLTAQGVQILAQNLHTRLGEIDLLAWHHHTLLFIEVRSRRSSRFGGAIASVDRNKQEKLIRAAQYLLNTLPTQLALPACPPCRFDVVAIQGETITWIRHAFVSE